VNNIGHPSYPPKVVYTFFLTAINFDNRTP